MLDAERFRLRFGPYRTPQFNYGVKVKDARRVEVKIVGLSNTPIPWPIAAKRGGKSPVLYGALLRAVQRESNQAVAHWWGVSGQTVTAWRKALGIGPTNDGTSKLRSAHFHEPWAEESAEESLGQGSRHWPSRENRCRPARQAAAAACDRGDAQGVHWQTALAAEPQCKLSESHKRRGSHGRQRLAAQDRRMRTIPASRRRQKVQ